MNYKEKAYMKKVKEEELKTALIELQQSRDRFNESVKGVTFGFSAISSLKTAKIIFDALRELIGLEL